MTRFTFDRTVDLEDPNPLVEFVGRHTGLSKQRIKAAMAKGALWRKRGRERFRRIRRAQAGAKPGDVIRLYYDENLLALPAPEAVCLHDYQRYSLWWKPAGLLTQGTRYTDHVSLLRQVEKRFSRCRPRLVHRLDRETMGLLMVAHDSRAAAELSLLFRQKKIQKVYRAEVRGDLTRTVGTGRIDRPLDGKPALTEITFARRQAGSETTLVELLLHSGRTHQIRRHLADLGFPIMGDPRYGRHNSHPQGLQLVAWALAWRCPFARKGIRHIVPDQFMPPNLINPAWPGYLNSV
jgi:tRNA pseudouridine32 synthase/23S rRNA pseudouridine746 synthase